MVKGNDHVLNIVFNNKEVMKSKMNIKNKMLCQIIINFYQNHEAKGNSMQSLILAK